MHEDKFVGGQDEADAIIRLLQSTTDTLEGYRDVTDDDGDNSVGIANSAEDEDLDLDGAAAKGPHLNQRNQV
jgi:hypothetical protein